MQPFTLWLAEDRCSWGGFGGFLGILDLVLPSRSIITILAMIAEGRCAGVGANAQVLRAFNMPWRTMLWLKVLANRVCGVQKSLLVWGCPAGALLARIDSI